MSEVGRPRGPSGGDELSRPDAGFHDDKVGGQLKSDEAARQRAAMARQGARPKRIDKEPERVAAASAFRGAKREEEPQQAEARRHQRALVSGQPQPRRRGAAANTAGGGAAGGVAGEVERMSARVHTLFATLATLDAAPAGGGHRRVEAVDEQAPRGQGGRQQGSPDADDDAPPAPAGSLAGRPPVETPEAAAERLARAEQQARFHLQHLIVGGTGFPLAAEPKDTFSALFARMPSWPQRVPPGRTPESQADFDAFFAWIFAPAELVEGEPPLREP